MDVSGHQVGGERIGSAVAMTSPYTVRRRDLLIIGGAAPLFFSTGCALLRGGAKHPIYQKSEAALSNGGLRIPVTDLPARGAVLQVKTGKPYPEILITSDGQGGFLVATADCTHKGCTVDWDPAVSEWICPCHDSRFGPDGKVLGGPAEQPLSVPPSKLEGDALAIDLTQLARR